MIEWIKTIFCRHKQSEFVANIYGDQINAWGGKRSLWRCSRCGLLHAKDQLFTLGIK